MLTYHFNTDFHELPCKWCICMFKIATSFETWIKYSIISSDVILKLHVKQKKGWYGANLALLKW